MTASHPLKNPHEDLEDPAQTLLAIPAPSGDPLVKTPGERGAVEVLPGGRRVEEGLLGAHEGLTRVSKDQVLEQQGVLHLEDGMYVSVP